MKDYIVSALKPLVPYIPLLPKPVLSKLQYVPVLPAPVRAVAPYLPLLPTPLLTLGPTVAFHIASHSSPSPTAFFTASTTYPLHAPLLFLLSSIPFTYTLGLITNNVSWVDRWWPFYTPFCSFLLVLHMVYNEHAKVLTHNAPRAFLLFGLQLCWSIRLLSHARKRGFYDLTGEDYRYTQVRKIIPKWAFALIHLFVIAIAQPVLIFSLCLPVHAVMSMPPSELSAGPISALSIPFSSLIPFLPISRISAPPSTPILNLADLFLTALSVGLLYVEWTSDRQMYEFQESKHNAPKDTKRIHPGPFTPRSMFTGAPQPASFPVSHNPGFPTKSLWRYSRHPNFAAEQLFWFTQALFVVGAAESSGITRSGWVGGSVFGPAFALSLLFCSSTLLTEWISGCKYPSYSKYRQLVGQFLPQETAILWLWAQIMGTRAKLERELYQDQEDPKRKQKKSS